MAVGPFEWVVPARIVRVVDADTVTCDLDLGWHLTRRDPVRVATIDAPEARTPLGDAATAYARTLLQPGQRVIVRSHGLDKYGRTLGSLTLDDLSDYAVRLIAAGHAAPYAGGPR